MVELVDTSLLLHERFNQHSPFLFACAFLSLHRTSGCRLAVSENINTDFSIVLEIDELQLFSLTYAAGVIQTGCRPLSCALNSLSKYRLLIWPC